MEAQKKLQLVIAERTWESFTMEMALELDLKGCGTLKKRERLFWLRTT